MTDDHMTLSGYRMTLPIDHAFNINLASEKTVEEGAKLEGNGEEAEYGRAEATQ